MGNRDYILNPIDYGGNFTMSKKIGGPLFPLFAGTILPFDDTFNQYAADLKKEGEKTANS